MPQSNGGVSTTSRLTLFPMQNPITRTVGFYSFDPAVGFNDPNATSTHFFKVEEVLTGRTPTVSRVILVYRDLGPAIVQLTLTGTVDIAPGNVLVSSQQIVSNTVSVVLGTQPPGFPTGKLITKIVGLTLTANNIQLSIFRPARGGPVSFAKIVMCGRVEIGEFA